jgi:small subunit ribosomal protein S2
MPYVNHRWLGGMLTNFQTVSKRLSRLKELEEIDFDDVAGSGHTKKELLMMRGSTTSWTAPWAASVTWAGCPRPSGSSTPRRSTWRSTEARKLGIPVIAILDTNCDPDEVDYKIPGNDDAIRSCRRLLTRVAEPPLADARVCRRACTCRRGDRCGTGCRRGSGRGDPRRRDCGRGDPGRGDPGRGDPGEETPAEETPAEETPAEAPETAATES